MLHVKVEHLKQVQVMIIQNEFNGIYQVIVEGYQNYSFSPDYVSKGYKSLNGVKNHFNNVVKQYTSQELK